MCMADNHWSVLQSNVYHKMVSAAEDWRKLKAGV